MSDEIDVVNVRPGPGAGSVLAVCDVCVGPVKIYGVLVRKGRGNATYVNLPRYWRDGHWSPAIEITARDLLDQVHSAVILATLEAARYGMLD